MALAAITTAYNIPMWLAILKTNVNEVKWDRAACNFLCACRTVIAQGQLRKRKSGWYLWHFRRRSCLWLCKAHVVQWYYCLDKFYLVLKQWTPEGNPAEQSAKIRARAAFYGLFLLVFVNDFLLNYWFCICVTQLLRHPKFCGRYIE